MSTHNICYYGEMKIIPVLFSKTLLVCFTGSVPLMIVLLGPLHVGQLTLVGALYLPCFLSVHGQFVNQYTLKGF